MVAGHIYTCSYGELLIVKFVSDPVCSLTGKEMERNRRKGVVGLKEEKQMEKHLQLAHV